MILILTFEPLYPGPFPFPRRKRNSGFLTNRNLPRTHTLPIIFRSASVGINLLLNACCINFKFRKLGNKLFWKQWNEARGQLHFFQVTVEILGYKEFLWILWKATWSGERAEEQAHLRHQTVKEEMVGVGASRRRRFQCYMVLHA